MNLQDVLAKLYAAQDAVNQFKQQMDALVASMGVAPPQAPPPPVEVPVTGDTPTEKVPAVLPPPAQTYSGEHSA